jgi:hypothetical protein
VEPKTLPRDPSRSAAARRGRATAGVAPTCASPKSRPSALMGTMSRGNRPGIKEHSPAMLPMFAAVLGSLCCWSARLVVLRTTASSPGT